MPLRRIDLRSKAELEKLADEIAAATNWAEYWAVFGTLKGEDLLPMSEVFERRAAEAQAAARTAKQRRRRKH
jgi:hypothetical protein